MQETGIGIGGSRRERTERAILSAKHKKERDLACHSTRARLKTVRSRFFGLRVGGRGNLHVALTFRLISPAVCAS